MKKILLLPLFTMESGHQQSSSALMDSLRKQDPSIECEKVDFLSYVNSVLEKSVSQLYLKWISKVPSLYSMFYKQFFYRKSTILQTVYETLFLDKMEKMIKNKQPDLIICTHCFPSFLVNKLKEYGVINIPVVNIYTDFFINDLWGKKQVELHFVPSKETMEQLVMASVPEENIIISGILTNDKFLKRNRRKPDNTKFHILVAGGSLGLGRQLSTLLDTKNSQLIEYRVLCGSNIPLYQKIASMNSNSIKPLSYITSPEQMNHLYNWADALVTKPGGVTISEALKKKIPIFIHSVLPGQEEMNMNFLEPRGLVQRLDKNRRMEEQILAALNNPVALVEINRAMNLFLNEIELKSSSDAARYIFNRTINHTANKRIQYIDQIFSSLYHSL